jgi:phage shock protein PspC (stress-responsive transcriptional regulator)
MGTCFSGVPMFDKATGRAVAVLVLLIAIAAALRGYLPGADRTEQQRPPDSGASLVYVAALLSVSLVIVAVALIARLRDPRRVAGSAAGLSDRFSDGRGRPRWRVVLVGAAGLVAWLLLLWLLSRLFMPQQMGQPQSTPQSTVPTPADNTPRRPAPPDGGADRDVLPILIVGTVALLAMIVTGAVVSARRRRLGQPSIDPADPLGALTPTVAAPALVRAAESGLAEIEDPKHEPRQAIIACYAAMERELSRFPAAIPQDFDTPTEVLARAVEHHALHIDNAVELVNLFEEARFSPHVMDESHRASALRVLRLVLAELRSAV